MSREWLGQRGFLWLAACAAYPRLRFNITLHLGLALSMVLPAGRVELFSERMLTRLALLPWFRVGRMPEWLREALLGAMAEEERGQVRQAVDRMLKGEAPNPTRPDGFAGSVRRSLGLTLWRPENRGLDLDPDAVMVGLMFGDLTPVVTGETFPGQVGDVLRQVLRERAAVIAASLAWCAVAWWVWPKAGTAPHAPGAWLPLVTLVGTTALCAAAVPAIALWRRKRQRADWRRAAGVAA